MCDCIRSTPISLSVTQFRRSPLNRFNQNSTYGSKLSNAANSNCAGAKNDRSLLFCSRTSRNPGLFGSEDYGFRAELGFKEKKGDNHFEFETSRGKTKQIGKEGEDSRGSLDSEFLQVKRGVGDQKDSGKSKESLEQENLIRVEGKDGDGDGDGDGEEGLVRESGNVGLKKGRQVVRRSSMLAKQVISIRSALCLGFVSQLWVDTNSVSSNAWLCLRLTILD